MRCIWAAVALLALAAIAWRFEPVVDLAWFLPAPETAGERTLIERLGQGPGSQLLFVSLQASPDANVRAVSAAVAAEMQASGLFSRVLNGPVEPHPDAIPSVVTVNRYLLSDIARDEAALYAILQARLADLAFISEPWMSELISSDPGLAALAVLEGLQPVAEQELRWVESATRKAVVVAETNAPAFEMGGQTAAIGFVRALDIPGLADLQVHGMGVYGVDLQDTIRREATLRSVAASVAVLLILLLAYRRPVAVLYGFIPLALGALSGLAVVALLFGKVHGITLAFGFTLLGIAIDYPLHYLSHARGSEQPTDIWPTMRIGMFSSVAAFAALAVGGSAGLLQMGVFSATGLLVAYSATRTLMPFLPPAGNAGGPAPAGVMQLLHWLWPLFLIAGVAGLAGTNAPRWTNDLSAITPVPAERILADQRLRAGFGAPDVRMIVVLRNADLQTVLEQTEAVASALDVLRQTGAVGGWQAVTDLVPSAVTQSRRRAAAAAAAVDERFSAVASAVGFRATSFAPYRNALREVAALPDVLPATYRGTALAGLVDAALYERNGEWVSGLTLFAVNDNAALRDGLATEVPAAQLIDLKGESESLMGRYRAQVLTMLMVAGVLIVIYLLVALRSPGQVTWVLGTLAAAQALTLLISSLVLGALSIFNLMAMVLVAGLGMDYALFFARRETSARSQQDTSHALTICALSTCGAFVILALSSIPVLQSMGVTVAAGVVCSYLLARLGRRRLSS